MSKTISRLTREYDKMRQKPHPQIICEFNHDNILEWHFLLHNLDEPYTGGQYHGIITIPPEYPFTPPSIQFSTPNGRFQVGEKICLSFTSHHPETWSPSWTLETMMIGVISFMYTNETTAGGIQTSSAEKKKLAMMSIQTNHQNPRFMKHFRKHLDKLGQPQQCVQDDTTETTTEQQTPKPVFFIGSLIVIIVIYILLIQ